MEGCIDCVRLLGHIYENQQEELIREVCRMTPEVKKRIDQIRHGIVPEGYKKGFNEKTCVIANTVL